MNITAELYEKMSRLQWLFHRQHLKAHATAGPVADTYRGQGRLLAFLKMKDGVSTKDLSYLLGIRVSSLNELLAKLERNGYITRQPSETDKRVILIYLTAKGREEEEEGPDNSNIFSCLSAEEQTAFGAYLDRIIAALEAELGTEDERDEMFDWMENARERMGAEHFEALMSLGGRMHGLWGGFGGGWHGFGLDRHGPRPHGAPGRHPGRPGFGPDSRGPAPEGRGGSPFVDRSDPQK